MLIRYMTLHNTKTETQHWRAHWRLGSYSSGHPHHPRTYCKHACMHG